MPQPAVFYFNYIYRGKTMQNEIELTPEQKWEQATLANNFIFYKVMRHHQDACKYLLEILLGIKIDSITMNTEETIALDFDSKGIRLDVFVKDRNRMFDVELQVTNTKELPERARYYQGVMDVDSLKAGQKYKELRESHVIFICLADIFHNGLPVNTFENICLEDGKTKLNDRAYKHFLFAPLCAKMIKDEETKAFFGFLMSNKASTDFTDELKIYVADAKQSTENKRQFMEWERQRAYDLEEGYEKGIAHKTIEVAHSLCADGVSIELIAKYLNITVEQVKEIVSEEADSPVHA